MLTDIGVPFVKWLHDKVCVFDAYLYRWLDLMDPGEDEEDD